MLAQKEVLGEVSGSVDASCGLELKVDRVGGGGTATQTSSDFGRVGSLWTVEEKRKRTPKEPCLGRCVGCVGLVDGGRAEGQEAPRGPRPVRDLAEAEISLFVRRTRFLQATHRSLPPRHLENLTPQFESLPRLCQAK